MSLPEKSTAPAFFVDQDCNFSIIRDVPVPELVDGEVVVKVLYSGVNPADVKHAPELGVRNVTLGYDFSGRVVKANGNSKFNVGDVVAGYTPTGIGKPLKYGAHQEYLASHEEVVFRVPGNLPHDHAAAITTVLATAADGLYNIFGYPPPGTTPSAGFKPGPLLIWGASASVGLCMLQLAKASGAHPIFVTASPKRHALLEKLGATRCFDYADPEVGARIRAATAEVGAGPIAYAADCAGSVGEVSSAELMLRSVDDEAAALSVVPPKDKRLRFPLALAHAPAKFQFPGAPVIEFPARPEAFEKMWKAVTWAVENYRKGFELPVVDVFRGDAEEAFKEVEKVAGQGKFGKLVLAQPLA
ncbi:Trans-enoyl reductase fsdC [Colletotrichum orbiculare MAFF 240422]|uniref:Trans-enoyl reductase fsdC n=1 Tax=Colletotrichum orbiculare (strain 104-T / ATCC 96160 / CBS 514.97 / LARS 414 / MAFF 240422) TaxID=1213857 RepID=N4W0D4_COLOR|nr:Trans-enoyl reductase fsdC [Colletotrichum orbiculare MAFF 240422]